MRHLDDEPEQLSPDERLREIAAVFAAGFLRLRDRPDPDPVSAPPAAPEKPSDSGPDCLEGSADTSVTVQAG
jgi:hypothetical protein